MKLFNKEAKKKAIESEKKLLEQRANNTQLSKKNRQLTDWIAVLEDELDTYKKNIQTKRNQDAKQIELDNQADMLKAKEKAQATLADEISKLTKKVEIAKEEGRKEGYADGIADGLRKVHEITAEDRRMLMQVAALAAASHTPNAADEIAKTTSTILKSLGDGKHGNGKG